MNLKFTILSFIIILLQAYLSVNPYVNFTYSSYLHVFSHIYFKWRSNLNFLKYKLESGNLFTASIPFVPKAYLLPL